MTKFIYDGVVTGENFCGRKEEIEKLLNYFNDSTNVLLFAKRRMGKTSLVFEIFENYIDRKKYLPIYADIFDIADENDFAKELYKAVAKAMKFDIKTLVKNLKSLFNKASFNIGIGHDGTPIIQPQLVQADYEELLADIFQGLEEYIKRHKVKVVFCIDEFQQIHKMKKPLDATIRKYIQNHNNISYVFTGSKKNILQGLFQGKSPLMGMVTPMELGPIKSQEFHNFVIKKLQKSMDKNVFEVLYMMAKKESKLLQHMCRNLSYLDGDIVCKEDIELVASEVLNEYDGICKDIIEQLSLNSIKVVKLVAYSQGHNILSHENQKRFNIVKSSIQAALDILIRDGMVFKEDDIYYLDGGIGATFALWCEARYC